MKQIKSWTHLNFFPKSTNVCYKYLVKKKKEPIVKKKTNKLFIHNE